MFSSRLGYTQYLGNSAYMAFGLATAHTAGRMNPFTAVVYVNCDGV